MATLIELHKRSHASICHTPEAKIAETLSAARSLPLWTPPNMRKVFAWRMAELEDLDAGRDRLKLAIETMSVLGEIVPDQMLDDYLEYAEIVALLAHELHLLQEALEASESNKR